MVVYAGSGSRLQVLGLAPEHIWREMDQALPAGAWRAPLDGDVWKLQRNTHTTIPFTTTEDWLACDPSASRITVGSATSPKALTVTGALVAEGGLSITGDLAVSGSLILGGDVAISRLAANVGGLAAGDSWRIPADGQLQFGDDVALSRIGANTVGLAAGDTLNISETGYITFGDIGARLFYGPEVGEIQLQSMYTNQRTAFKIRPRGTPPAGIRSLLTMISDDSNTDYNELLIFNSTDEGVIFRHQRFGAGSPIVGLRFDIAGQIFLQANPAGQVGLFGGPSGQAAVAVNPRTAPTTGAAAITVGQAHIGGSITVTGQTGDVYSASLGQNTLTAGAATTIPNAATLYLEGAPIGGAGPVTITNPYALWVAAGATRLDGILQFSTDVLLQRAAAANLQFVGAHTISTSAGALTLQPASGSNLVVTLATTGNFVVNTNQLFVSTASARVGIGTTSPSYRLHVLVEDAETSTATTVAAVEHQSTGTVAAGFGTAISLRAETSTAGWLAEAGRIVASWESPIPNGISRISLYFLSGGATAAHEGFRVGRSMTAVLDPTVNNNFGFWTTTVGSSAWHVIGIYTGTAPTTAPADTVQIWVADYAAGDARLHVRSEAGSPIIIGNNTVRATWATQAAADATVGLGVVSGSTYSLVRITSSLRYKEALDKWTLDTGSIYRLKLTDWISRASDNGRYGHSPIAEYAYDANPAFAQLDEGGHPIGINWANLNTAVLAEVQRHENVAWVKAKIREALASPEFKAWLQQELATA